MSKKVISTSKAPAAIGPYSQANFINGVLYISGQIPIDPETGNLVDGIEKETHQVMKNLKAILEEAGLTFSNVVKATIFLKNMDDFAAMNQIYASYLDENSYPARETVQVSCLPKNVSVEISMIAHQF
ncbi:RidA family protein [Cloacibacterium sp.]|jgi:2-iminobutanoate/2-iminopropanoate deaminase|uniref:RidA family protein n=1 Tax=Cloacibacterium sp. TaxID=1913682 RepID=UPI0035B13A50